VLQQSLIPKACIQDTGRWVDFWFLIFGAQSFISCFSHLLHKGEQHYAIPGGTNCDHSILSVRLLSEDVTQGYRQRQYRYDISFFLLQKGISASLEYNLFLSYLHLNPYFQLFYYPSRMSEYKYFPTHASYMHEYPKPLRYPKPTITCTTSYKRQDDYCTPAPPLPPRVVHRDRTPACPVTRA